MWTFFLLAGTAAVALATGVTAYRLHWQRRLLPRTQIIMLTVEEDSERQSSNR